MRTYSCFDTRSLIMVRAFWVIYFGLAFVPVPVEVHSKTPNSGDLSLWIDEQQVKMYSGKCDGSKGSFPASSLKVCVPATFFVDVM